MSQLIFKSSSLSIYLLYPSYTEMMG